MFENDLFLEVGGSGVGGVKKDSAAKLDKAKEIVTHLFMNQSTRKRKAQ